MIEHKLNASCWAKISGVSEATIRHYLSGRNKSITVINLEKLAAAVGTSPTFLLNNHASEPLHDIDSIIVEKDLFIQTFNEVKVFISEVNIELTPTMQANILLAWYKFAQIHREQRLGLQPHTALKDLVRALITNG